MLETFFGSIDKTFTASVCLIILCNELCRCVFRVMIPKWLDRKPEGKDDP